MTATKLRQQPLTFMTAGTVSITTAARLLGCSPDQAYRLREIGAIEGYQFTVKGWWKIDYESVIKYKEFLVNGGSIEQWLDMRRSEPKGRK